MRSEQPHNNSAQLAASRLGRRKQRAAAGAGRYTMNNPAALLIFFIVPGLINAGETGTVDSVGYPSVEAALSALQARQDPGTKITTHEGWTLATIGKGWGKTMWSFTPENHPAHPAAVKREVLIKDGMVYIRMDILCEADKHACNTLAAEFEQRNEDIRGRLQHSADNPKTFVKTAGKAITDFLDYDKKAYKLYRRSNDIAFSIYGKQQLEYITFQCDKSVYYDIGTMTASIVGMLSIGLCKNNPLLTQDIAQNQKIHMQTALSQLSDDLANTDEGHFERLPLGNGLSIDYFTVFIVGHGILPVHTSITTSEDPGKVLIIQYYGQHLCERLPEFKLCSEPKKALKELSLSLFEE